MSKRIEAEKKRIRLALIRIDEIMCPVINGKSCQCPKCHTGMSRYDPRECNFCIKRRIRKVRKFKSR